MNYLQAQEIIRQLHEIESDLSVLVLVIIFIGLFKNMSGK
jgi:hypothetical protein